MAKNKTTQNESSVADYVAAIADEKRQKDIAALIDLFTGATGLEAKMWGPGIVGFGSYHYKYASGHEGDAPLAGLASRANAITLYLDYELDTRDELIKQLAEDEAIQEADTILLTIPNTLGVDYNVHVLSSILEHVAPGLGWR